MYVHVYPGGKDCGKQADTCGIDDLYRGKLCHAKRGILHKNALDRPILSRFQAVSDLVSD